MQPIRTALCSFGMSGRVFHAPFLSTHPGFLFYAVWERTKNLAQELYPEVKTYRTLEEMLSDKLLELVIVNTPSVTHFEYAKMAIEAGKHVIVEKPFTATVDQATQLMELANLHQVKLSVFQNRRYDSDFRTVKKILDEGWLGKIIEAEIHYDRYATELSYKQHKETPTAAVGNLYDLGSHIIDQALLLFGMPQAVFADLAANRPGSLVDDYFDLKLFYPSHRVILKSSYYVREPLPAYIFHGTRGTFLKHKTDVQETDLQAGKMPGSADWGTEPDSQKGLLHTEKDGKLFRKFIPSLKGNYGDYYQEFFQAVRDHKALPVTAEEGKRVIQVIEAALKSKQQKKVTQI